MLIFFKDIISDRDSLDMTAVYRIALVHDICEIETGDFVITKKTNADGKREYAAIDIITKNIPSSIAKQFIEDKKRYDVATDLESRFVCAMDRFESFFFQYYSDGVKMIKTLDTDINIRHRNLDRLLSIMDNLSFPELSPYTRVLCEELIHNRYLKE